MFDVCLLKYDFERQIEAMEADKLERNVEHNLEVEILRNQKAQDGVNHV